MATLLDTFVSVFTSDTDELRRGHDQAKRTTDEMVRSMREADQQAKRTDASVRKLITGVAGAVLSIAAARSTLSTVLQKAGDIYQMNQTAESIGVAVGNLDAFTRSVEDNGGTAEGVISTLSNAYRSMGRAISDTKSRQAQAFADMGIKLKDSNGQLRDTMDVVLDISEAMSGLEGGVAESLVQRLGITDRRTIEVMLRGREAIEDMMRAHKEYGVVSELAAQRAGEFSDATSYLAGGIDRLWLRLTTALMPAITWTANLMAEGLRWMHDNMDFVIGFFGAIAAVIAAKFLPAMLSAAGATLVAIAPFLLIGAAIAAVAVAFGILYDDIQHYRAGNKSMIGELEKDYPELAALVLNVADVIQGAFEKAAAVFKWFAEQLGFAFDDTEGFLTGYLRFQMAQLETIAGWANSAFELYDDFAKRVAGVFEWLWEQVKKFMSWITGGIRIDMPGWIQSVLDWVSKGTDEVGGPEPKGPTGPEVPIVPPTAPAQGPEVPIVPPTAPAQGPEVPIVPPTAPAQGPEVPIVPPTAPAQGPEVPIVPFVIPEIEEANAVLNQASKEPMNSVTSSAIYNSRSDSRTEQRIEIGEIVVQTQATNSRDIASGIKNELADQLQNLSNEYATGVAR